MLAVNNISRCYGGGPGALLDMEDQDLLEGMKRELKPKG